MHCMGSKGRITNQIVPIIQSYIKPDTIAYIEPFVGGANVIDKIQCDVKIGYDINQYLISTLSALQNGWKPPLDITKEQYYELKNNPEKYSPELVGYVGLSLSFGSKWFNGYYRYDKRDEKRDRCREAYNSAIRQSQNLSNIDFIHGNYFDVPSTISGAVIYCDPPYVGTTKYSVSKDFDYEKYYEWCRKMSQNNIVLMSEYIMPDDFECIWEKQTITQIDNHNTKTQPRVERLFIYKGE